LSQLSTELSVVAAWPAATGDVHCMQALTTTPHPLPLPLSSAVAAWPAARARARSARERTMGETMGRDNWGAGVEGLNSWRACKLHASAHHDAPSPSLGVEFVARRGRRAVSASLSHITFLVVGAPDDALECSASMHNI